LSALALLRTPAVARLLSSSLLGRLPTGMVPLALVLVTRQSGFDFATAGLLTASYAAGSAVGGPMLSRVIDRSRQSRVLVLSAITSSAALALLPLLGSVPALAAAALAGLSAPPLEPCLRSLWPVVLPPTDAPQALAVDAAAQQLVFVTGPLVVLAAVLLFDASGGLAAAAVVGLAGTLWFASTPASRTWRASEVADRHWAGPLRSSRMRRLYLVVALVGTTVGVFAVSAVAYAEMKGNASFGAWVVAANALGALLGELVYSERAGVVDARRALPALVGALALAYLPLAALPPEALMLAAAVLSGAFLPPVLTCLFQLTDALAPVGTTTEAFAWLTSAFLVGSAAGAAVSGQLAASGATGVAFLTAAGTSLVAAVTARRLLRRPRHSGGIRSK